MKATEDEFDLALRGYVMARGNYTPDQIKRMSDLDIAYLSHYQNLVEEQRQKFWTDALGIIWHRDEFMKNTEGPQVKTVKDSMFIPLSVVIEPNLMERIRENFGLTKEGRRQAPHIAGGEYIPESGDAIQSMEHLSKEDFKKMFGGR